MKQNNSAKKLPKNKDRRYKLNEDERKHVKELVEMGQSVSYVARMYNVSPLTVKLIANENYRKRIKENARGKWRKYYDKEKHRINTQNHRKYKKQIMEELSNDAFKKIN